jgi:hypothetical protein
MNDSSRGDILTSVILLGVRYSLLWSVVLCVILGGRNGR